MNPLQLDDNQFEYESVEIQDKEETRKQHCHQCSKRASILISLLVCCMLAITLVSKNRYGKVKSIVNDVHNIFNRRDILTDNNIDYTNYLTMSGEDCGLKLDMMLK